MAYLQPKSGKREQAKNASRFYLARAPIELRGLEAVKLIHASMNEMLVRHDIAIGRITSYPSYLTGMMYMLTSPPMNSRGPNRTCFIIRFEGIGKCEDVGKPGVWKDRGQGRGP
ncbi:hypothetical protein EV401DRAFT_1897078 [Pisolithus croceorrhizus]|nr:hypothetical protein EV401DRAFT_1897078 [Pisolithus croceorrhizus]